MEIEWRGEAESFMMLDSMGNNGSQFPFSSLPSAPSVSSANLPESH